ncbi:DUF5708 family protein [Streptomyces sp. NPDC004787]|uniref:DUF5708 family protein n=1 Tax=Streptomyces sp. NPDC004787 TaxID=3154291 RepID=UPI0033A0E93A
MKSRGTGNLREGAILLPVGLGLGLFPGDVDVPVLTLTKVGVVLMVVGGSTLLYGAFQTVSAARGARPGGSGTADRSS